MKLITKKSECKSTPAFKLVKSPKEAIRKTLSNYIITDGIVRSYMPSYVSKDEIVLRNMEQYDDFTISLLNNYSVASTIN